NKIESDWTHSLKKKILFGLMGLLSVYFILLVSIVVLLVKNACFEDSKGNVQELSSVIESSLRHLMLTRSPYLRQAIEQIVNNKGAVSSIMILNNRGVAAYSTEQGDVGKIVSEKEAICLGCHRTKDGHLPSQYTMAVKNKNGVNVLRNLSVIPNEPQCYGCHGSAAINGKLIVDLTLERSSLTTMKMDALIIGSGLCCLLLLIPLLSVKINKYIAEIISQSEEVNLLYAMVEKLSKTINIEELKKIVVDIFSDCLMAGEVSVVMPKRSGKYSVFTKHVASDGIVRRKVEADDPLIGMINLWIEGKLNSFILSRDKGDIYLNISKSGEPLALINAKRTSAPFKIKKVELLRALSGHIATAFENSHLYAMAITDELTRLYTKRHFSYTIEKELTAAEKLGKGISLLMIDLDDFRRVNDSYGHIIGDFVLEATAQRIRDSIRESDLAFRYGGEEFAVILPDTDVLRGHIVAERIRKNIENTAFEQDGLSIKMTVSVGLADYNKNEDVSSAELLAKADSALYEAKWVGKNTVVIRDERHGG
ncbi:MAG: GGDEF domain-containing protein, partial [Nitrospirae bacterium]|nr:GGDEF domain-containing protein [Nitrospirota bacterium]